MKPREVLWGHEDKDKELTQLLAAPPAETQASETKSQHKLSHKTGGSAAQMLPHNFCCCGYHTVTMVTAASNPTFRRSKTRIKDSNQSDG